MIYELNSFIEANLAMDF